MALMGVDWRDLIGSGRHTLIPALPPMAAIEARRRRANESVEGDLYHSMANPAKSEQAGEWGLPNKGYRLRKR